MNEQHELALPQGTHIGDFQFDRVLGHGGFGITYLGWNIALDIPVAIKEYLPTEFATRRNDITVVPQSSQVTSDFEWGLERFVDEARTLARFSHPNIIRVHHFFQAHGTAYIVMEYAEGETLSAYLNGKGVLPESELKQILYPILAGLEVVHRADFLHRDIKPGNIIIRAEDASPVLLDFGAARQAVGAKSRSITSVFTPGYAPIEQYSSRGDQGPWTDIYALGVVCYRALTGEVPDDSTDRMRRDLLIPLSEQYAGRASPEFLSAIDWALQVDEEARPQSIGDWHAAFEGASPCPEYVPIEDTVPSPSVGSGSVSTEGRPKPPDRPPEGIPKDPPLPPPEVGSKDRDRSLWGVFGVCFVLLAGVGGYLFLQGQERQAELRQRQAEEAAALDRQVSTLLSGAKADMSSDRLTSPVGNNAWEKYQAILALEPGHKVASAGLDSIISRYVSKFEASLRRKEFSDAEGYMSRIQSVYADAPVLSELAGRLSEAREAERQRKAAEVERARQATEAERARQAAEAEQSRQEEQRVGRRFKDCVECPEMVVVPSGSFTMGSPNGEHGREDDEGPRHRVNIAYPFAVGVYEVTFSEWEACVNAGGCGGYVPEDEGWGRGNRPVINVSWKDAQSYAVWLSEKTGHEYRLLSASEWEYVARAGTTMAYSWGDEIGRNRANCDDCGNLWDDQTAPVGSFSANAWGVHDMHGNVWEWVQDCWNDSYVGAPLDGSAWESENCGRRVLRGGSWSSSPRSLRSAMHEWTSADLRFGNLGFRVLRRF